MSQAKPFKLASGRAGILIESDRLEEWEPIQEEVEDVLRKHFPKPVEGIIFLTFLVEHLKDQYGIVDLNIHQLEEDHPA
jgi:hypothetical protein